MENRNLIEVKNLKKYFQTPKGFLHAVDDVTFNIKKGTTLGVVGESGCGKSTTGRTLLRLLDATGGKVYYDGIDINKLNNKEMNEIRKEMQIIFQDPYSSLNPRKTVAKLIETPLKVHKVFKNKIDREKRVKELMELVGLSERLYNSYPHELDGGRRQRVVIARALALEPKFIMCDEPVSALDVSIQAQIINLLQDLQEKMGLTYMFITHDLSVVKHISDEIAVMYLGQIIEKADKNAIFDNPLHPYTQALLSAIPVVTLEKPKNRILLEGEISSPINPKIGCRFASRCRFVTDKCRTATPKLQEVSKGHFIACARVDEMKEGKLKY